MKERCRDVDVGLPRHNPTRGQVTAGGAPSAPRRGAFSASDSPGDEVLRLAQNDSGAALLPQSALSQGCNTPCPAVQKADRCTLRAGRDRKAEVLTNIVPLVDASFVRELRGP